MDPLSISVSCITLITTITQVSVAVTNFVREVRDARGDLDAISRELVSLKSVLELLAEDTEGPHTATLPERLKDQIIDILKNCKHVVTDVEASLKKHSASRLGRAGHWAVGGGKGDMTKFRSSLETHKTALGLALDMVAITITRDIKDDTQEIRKDTAAIKDDTALILEQIAQLQAQLPQNIMKDTSNHMLHRYLDDLSDFAELMSNPPEDEPEISKTVDSEPEDEIASSPTSTPKNPEVPPHRRPSSLLREMYTEPLGTSTPRNSVQHISKEPFKSPTPKRASMPTAALHAGTAENPCSSRQEEDVPQSHQSSSPPSFQHLKPDPSAQDDNSPYVPRSFTTLSISPWALSSRNTSTPIFPQSAQDAVTSLAAAPKAPKSPAKETGVVDVAKAKVNAPRGKQQGSQYYVPASKKRVRVTASGRDVPWRNWGKLFLS
ncbi:hypothetical protein HBI56_155850 [Parastagonospora nodorum]|nr:hypothetical protein HBH56_118540 [Parastagonospora nodorum]QRD05298.1 hypothetical protein JI435_111950 [Parastagonospora nodorum SN15]KAH3929067.1 hypothetical protein HBH54_130650 [Parastagonospora nodorum]KAH3959748.1 hypothetical protein HBH51_196950 [Parastagonospora nodorum]KAH4136495.1 hypothetical protein HBH45_134300 [Parastagonospora nodorum]